MRHQGAEDYRKIIESYRWRKLRSEYLAAHRLCEECEAQGKTALAQDVHHVTPIETAKTFDDMCALAYDKNNLQALCKKCHEEKHIRLGSGANRGRKQVKEAAQRKALTFLRNWSPDLAPEASPGV